MTSLISGATPRASVSFHKDGKAQSHLKAIVLIFPQLEMFFPQISMLFALSLCLCSKGTFFLRGLTYSLSSISPRPSVPSRHSIIKYIRAKPKADQLLWCSGVYGGNIHPLQSRIHSILENELLQTGSFVRCVRCYPCCVQRRAQLQWALSTHLLNKHVLGRSHWQPVRRIDRVGPRCEQGDQLGTRQNSFGENVG